MRLTVESAPEFVQQPTTVSVLGVFRDGRMNPDAWEQIGGTLSQPFHEALCPAGYGPTLREKQPDLALAVDRATREEGLSDELLDKVAPMAQGELVMAVTLYRYVPRPSHPTTTAPMATAAPPGGAMGSRGGGGGFGRGTGGGGSGPPPQDVEESVFEISVSLFSVKQHHLVARLDMRSSVDEMDKAMLGLQTRLGTVLPQSKCVGWSW